MKSNIIIQFIFIYLGSLGNLWALIPLESLTLGDFTEDMKKEDSDPLNYVFNLDLSRSKVQFKRLLSNYRGFYEEGENLKNFCKIKYETNYPVGWQREKVKRSVAATLQYIGIDITTRALPEYAKHFNFSRDEYKNLVNRLVGNFCSINLSIISKKSLIKNMMFEYDKRFSFNIPTLDGNPLFPESIKKFSSEDDFMKKEFLQGIRVFKSFCSWGGNINDFRLLVPFLKNPIIMGFVIRQLSGEKLNWESVSNSISLEKSENSVQVLCDNLICRRKTNIEFNSEIPRMLGTPRLKDDLKRLYCEDFEGVDFKLADSPPKIKKLITKFSFVDQILMQGHLISLLTGVPDLVQRGNLVSDIKESLRGSMDNTWINWAKSELENRKKELFYEEPISIELVTRNIYFHPFIPKFKVLFDINMGEIDRANQAIGKIKVSFNIKIVKSYLKYIRRMWKSRLPENVKKRKYFKKIFTLKIIDQVKKYRKKFLLPPWTGPLEKLIVKELLAQLSLYKGSFFKNSDHSMVSVPIELNYGLFALKYIRYQKKVRMKLERKRKFNLLLTKDEKSKN